MKLQYLLHNIVAINWQIYIGLKLVKSSCANFFPVVAISKGGNVIESDMQDSAWKYFTLNSN